jgi:hypothetical protein
MASHPKNICYEIVLNDASNVDKVRPSVWSNRDFILDGSLAEVKTTMAEEKAKCEAPNVDKSSHESRDGVGVPTDACSSILSHLRGEAGVERVVSFDV